MNRGDLQTVVYGVAESGLTDRFGRWCSFFMIIQLPCGGPTSLSLSKIPAGWHNPERRWTLVWHGLNPGCLALDSEPIFYSLVAKWVEKAMAPHSSTLAWQIPWTEELGRLQSMGSLGVVHD